MLGIPAYIIHYPTKRETHFCTSNSLTLLTHSETTTVHKMGRITIPTVDAPASPPCSSSRAASPISCFSCPMLRVLHFCKKITTLKIKISGLLVMFFLKTKSFLFSQATQQVADAIIIVSSAFLLLVCLLTSRFTSEMFLGVCPHFCHALITLHKNLCTLQLKIK